MSEHKQPGDKCGCCRDERLIEVRGALVCPRCDCVAQWPKEKRGGVAS